MTRHNRSPQLDLAPRLDLDPQLGLNFDDPAPTRRIWPVNELVTRVRESVEQAYGDVWVEGEISNCRPAPSGHLYFTLKDAGAQLPVVLFRRQALLLRFRPEDGLHVLVRGKVSVYEQRGQMQLVAETMEPVGAGSLQLAFEQLKERLKAEGLFDAARKRPLPAFPRTAGIVTSPTGAVIRDFLNIVGRRHSGLNVLLYPVSVQGESAPAEIEAAIADLNAASREGPASVDLIVLARGGGSLEDLAAFNSERVARAIAASRLPVVSAVGHETDFTIADFAADLRAPTPSAAAELITEAQHKIFEHLATQAHRLERAMRFQLLHARRCFADLSIARADSRISMLLHRRAQRLDDLAFRQESALAAQIRLRQSRIASLAAAVLRHDPRQSIAQTREVLVGLRTRLDRSLERVLQSSAFTLNSLQSRLHSLSPLAVLDRGYALVLADDGSLIRSVSKLTSGDTVTTRLSDGAFTSRVEAATPNAAARGKKGIRSKS
ncbi:MAG TPA: exodeoxyribonuclease VII large subunit [Terracidiphilus sp.]|jgi:exodeoxyribonuclease VII large subunit